MQVSVKYWKQGEKKGNFGDALTLLYMDRFFENESRFSFGSAYLVGSVIENARIRQAIVNGYEKGDNCGQAIFWGCGKQDPSTMDPTVINKAIFCGVRGIHTRNALGLPKATPLGDTAFLLPRFYKPKPHAETTGKVLWIPHFHHEDPKPEDLEGCPDYLIRRPDIPNTVEACEEFIDAIASAKFVMANAMHAAVVALAYGVPFSFWGGTKVNLPFKWKDLTSAMDFEMGFQSSYLGGLGEFDKVRPDQAFAKLDMDPILKVAPFKVKA